jgi:hypothetical protein
VDVGWEGRRRSPISDEQVGESQRKESDKEECEQRELGADHSPKNITAVKRIMPEIVDIEPCHGASEDKNEHEQSAESDEDAAAADAAPWAIDRKVL